MKISSNALKIIAVIAMTIDHAALLLVAPYSELYVIMRLVGRLTAPIMTCLLVEGFHHTRSRKKYIGRLAVFAVISQPFYSLMVSGSLNVLYTFAVSLVMLSILDSKKIKIFAKIILVGLCLAMSMLGDFGIIIPVWAGFFYFMRGRNFDYGTKVAVFGLATFLMVEFMQISFIQHGAMFALIPLYYYSGKRVGQAKNKTFNAIDKWGAYVYYPLHIAILVALSLILGRY
jgi:hypothetical protein